MAKHRRNKFEFQIPRLNKQFNNKKFFPQYRIDSRTKKIKQFFRSRFLVGKANCKIDYNMALVTKNKSRFVGARSSDLCKFKRLVKRHLKYHSWRHRTAAKTVVWRYGRFNSALQYEPDDLNMIAFAKPIVPLPKSHNIVFNVKYNIDNYENEQPEKSERSTFKKRLITSSQPKLNFFLSSRLSGTRGVSNKNYLK